MAIFESGKIIDLLTWLVVWALTGYALMQARQGKTRDIKFLPGIPAILEGINKSTEEGKPAMFLHCGKLYGPYALSVLASLNVCSYTAQNCASLGPDLISVAMEYPETYPVMIETVKEAYTAAGKADAYRDEMVRYYPGYSYTMEVMGLIEQKTWSNCIYGKMGPLFNNSVNNRLFSRGITGSWNRWNCTTSILHC
jgi:hypothetical protein